MKFEKIKKRFALSNSYFKNRRPQDPKNPLECLEYYQEYSELPYNSDIHENWIYDCFIEYQKRTPIVHEQFFTPPHVADDMVNVFLKHADIKHDVTEPFCGYGQITKCFFKKCEEEKKDFCALYQCIDISDELIRCLKMQMPELDNIYTEDVLTLSDGLVQNSNFIANPPYSVKTLTNFIEKLSVCMNKENVAVLLLPQGFIHKKTKAIQEAMSKFDVVVENRYGGKTFAHTGVLTEILVLKIKI